MSYWSELEADLAEAYGVLDPLRLSWRKLIVLIAGLRPESRFSQLQYQESPAARRALLRQAIDNPGAVRRRVVDADTFIAGVG